MKYIRRARARVRTDNVCPYELENHMDNVCPYELMISEGIYP